MIDYLKSLGYKVYGPERFTTYCFFTDGVRIGYAQKGGKYTTVHVPCRSNGTGFQADSPEQALTVMAGYGYQPTVPVQKYRDFEHFRRQHCQKLVEY